MILGPQDPYKEPTPLRPLTGPRLPPAPPPRLQLAAGAEHTCAPGASALPQGCILPPLSLSCPVHSLHSQMFVFDL